MERNTELYIEVLVAKEFGKSIDEWLEKPEEVRFLHRQAWFLEKAKEAYWNTPKKDRMMFLLAKRR